MKQAALLACIFATTFAMARARTGVSPADKDASDVPADRARGEHALCAGGPESSLGVELTPAEVIATGRQKTTRFELQVHSEFKQSMKYVTAFELVDDSGRAQHAPGLSAARNLSAGATVSHSYGSPAGLKDGFYLLRATVLAESTDQTARESQLAEQHLEVVGGELSPISIDEWLERSSANRMIPGGP